MVDNKACLVVMVAYLDLPLLIQNILEVLVGLIHLFLDLMADQQKLCSPLWASLHAHSQALFPLEFMVWTSYQQQYGLVLLQMEFQ